MSESVEVRLARLEERFEFLVDEAKEAKLSRKGQYEAIETMGKTILSISTQVNDVKSKLDGQAPTIEEFITIKHKVVGAGKLGRWLWAAGAFLIGTVYSSREAILSWLTK